MPRILLVQVKPDQPVKPEQTSPLQSGTNGPKPPHFIHQLSGGSQYSVHRIIGWKRPLRSSSPTVTLTPPCLLNHVPRCHIYTFFKHLRGRGLHHLPGQPVPTSEFLLSRDWILLPAAASIIPGSQIQLGFFSDGSCALDDGRRGARKGLGDSRLLLSASEGDQGRQTRGERRWCPRAVFMLFWLSPQFQITGGEVCPSPAAALLLGWLWYLSCLIF